MDVKKLGRINDGGGWKAHGRQMGSTSANKKAKIGFDYVHSLVDDHSRLAYSEILDDEKGPTCAAFLLRAADNFATYGIDRIQQVMTDNHWSYSRSADMRTAIALPLAEREGREAQPDPADRMGIQPDLLLEQRTGSSP